MDAQQSWLIAGWAAIHLMGFTTAWVSRWSIGRRVERANQVLLMAASMTIACLAVLHMRDGYQLSLLSATTLGAMVVCAVYDVRHDAEDRVLSDVMAVYEQSPPGVEAGLATRILG